MERTCQNQVRRGGELVSCGGEIKQIISLERGKRVVDEVCDSCGHSPSTQPFIIHEQPRSPVITHRR